MIARVEAGVAASILVTTAIPIEPSFLLLLAVP